jgi:hypothetical protein
MLIIIDMITLISICWFGVMVWTGTNPGADRT